MITYRNSLLPQMHIELQQNNSYASTHTVLCVFILKLLRRLILKNPKNKTLTEKNICLQFKQDVTFLPLYTTPGSLRLVCLFDCS